MQISTQTKDFASESGHWYDKDGSPKYSIVGANGKERATTLRDARKLALLPSVSTILQIEARPGLERWKIEQGMLACLTLPRNDGETLQEFMARALTDSREQARKAADRGTHLHGVLEKSARCGWRAPISEEDTPFITPVIEWLKFNFEGFTWSPERSFACVHGFGGKLDLHGESGEATVVIDYKFKDFKAIDGRLAYDEHCTQLAAYAHGLGQPEALCVNLFVSSTVPGLIYPCIWGKADIAKGWKAFQHLLALWQLRKDYCP